MKLSTKLIIMTISTILVPMLVILLFSAFTIYQSSTITQWEYLEGVQQNLEKDMVETETTYMRIIKDAADYDFIRDKLYVYEKYWTQLTDSLVAYDIEPINNYLEDLSLENDIESITLYRRFGDTFSPVAAFGENEYRPDVLYKKLIQPDYSKITYKRYPDGIFLDIIYPIFSEGKLVGLIQFMHSYNKPFFDNYSNIFNIKYTVISKNAVLFSSNGIIDDAVKQALKEEPGEQRISFRAGSSTYNGFVRPYRLGKDAYGSMVLFSERMNLFSGESHMIQRLVAVTLLCIMFPVVAFFIKEMRLINAINSLLAATDAISAGDYKVKVEVKSDDELGMLNANFNQMVAVLKENRGELERQNTELAMKNSYIDAVFQSLRINIIVLDPELKIKVVSKNASSRLELTEEQYGREFLSVEPFIQEANLLKKTVDEVVADKKFTRLYSVKFGATSFEMDFYPVIEDDRSLSAVVLVLNNITERMNMERALMHSDRLASVGQMAAGLAHEINNPMSIILNHVQLIKSDQLTEDERERFVNRIESEIKRVSKLINNLLKFSKDEALQPENIKLGEILSEVAGLFDPKANAQKTDEFYDGRVFVKEEAVGYQIKFKDKNINFFITQKAMDYKLVCGRDSLKQVLFNVMKNAFESCSCEDGIIWVGVEHVYEGTKINLTDNGCGIADDDLVNVFELFYTQGKPATGVGLGLPLCRRLMNNMGGEIGIESIKGEGSTVTLLFPDREGFYG